MIDFSTTSSIRILRIHVNWLNDISHLHAREECSFKQRRTKNLVARQTCYSLHCFIGIVFQLHIAVTNGYVSAARMLLENSANVNASDSHMWTPLHCAAKYSQVNVCVKFWWKTFTSNPHVIYLNEFDKFECQSIPKLWYDKLVVASLLNCLRSCLACSLVLSFLCW